MQTTSKHTTYTPAGPLWAGAIFLFTLGLLAVNRYTPLYINNDIVHYLLLLCASYSLVLLAGYLVNRVQRKRSWLIALVAVAALCFAKAFLTWGGEWKTQAILYRHKADRAKTIEFQMRGDRFSFGYKKRVVGRLRILPFIDWITDLDTLEVDTLQWIKANEPVNELGLKYYRLPESNRTPSPSKPSRYGRQDNDH